MNCGCTEMPRAVISRKRVLSILYVNELDIVQFSFACLRSISLTYFIFSPFAASSYREAMCVH
jgi:hypothetical protein